MIFPVPRLRALAAFPLVVFAAAQAFAEGSPGGENFGDLFYASGRHDLARLEYEKVLAGEESERVRAKLGLAELRLGRNREALETLRRGRGFSVNYLAMYAAMKNGGFSLARLHRDFSLEKAGSERDEDHVRLLEGTLPLERGDYAAARLHYRRLQRETRDEDTRILAGMVLSGISDYERTPRKSPGLAAAFSAVLPGSGQVYTGHYADGAAAFFFNTMFLGSALVMHDLERRADAPHTASGLFGLVGLFFYFTNVTGAAASAQRHNIYHERRFQQGIRDRFLNLDHMERTSGLEFKSSF